MAVRSWASEASAQKRLEVEHGQAFKVLADAAGQQRAGEVPGGLLGRGEVGGQGRHRAAS